MEPEPSITELEEEVRRMEAALWELQQSGAPVNVLQSLQTDIDSLYDALNSLRGMNQKDSHLET